MFLQHQILVTMTQINILRKPFCSDEQMNTKNNQKEDAPSKLKSRELISVLFLMYMYRSVYGCAWLCPFFLDVQCCVYIFWVFLGFVKVCLDLP